MAVVPKAPPHIHRAGDGRGMRYVFVNGRQVVHVFFVDVQRGIVRAYRDPIKVHKHRKRVISKTFRGLVQVLFPRKRS